MSAAEKKQKKSELPRFRDIDDLYQVVTPIFDGLMGQRMELARMKMLMSQSEVAGFLGISQQTLSGLERGIFKVPKIPFSLYRFMLLFKAHSKFVLLGQNADLYDRNTIEKNYWIARLNMDKRRLKTY